MQQLPRILPTRRVSNKFPSTPQGFALLRQDGGRGLPRREEGQGQGQGGVGGGGGGACDQDERHGGDGEGRETYEINTLLYSYENICFCFSISVFSMFNIVTFRNAPCTSTQNT